jgi:hypothetical protein
MEPILSWHSPEHNFNRKSADWYWILGAITLGAAFLAFYFHNFIFGIFILLAGLIVGILSFHDTPIVPISISAAGITLGRNMYAFKSFQSFWIETDHVHGTHIFLKSLSSFRPLVTIPVNEEVDLDDLHEVLLHFLDEEYLEESIVHKWFDKIISY